MTDRTVVEKLRYKTGMRAYVAHAPDDVDLGLPAGSLTDTPGDAEFMLVFATTQAEAVQRIREIAPAVHDQTVLWIGYPKGGKVAGRDISRDTLMAFSGEAGLIANANFAIDDTWSAVRMRPRRAGE